MAEYLRVGVEAARVEDIVAAAGVSWGTFFHYFPSKEDVLLDAAGEIARAFASAATSSIEAGEDVGKVFANSFDALFEAAGKVAPTRQLQSAVLQHVVNHPGQLSASLGEENPPPIRVASEIVAEGQRRGEVRSDQPAESLAVIVLYAVLFCTQRGATVGRPPGSISLTQLALDVVLRGMRPDETAQPDQYRHGLPEGGSSSHRG